jgi:hypothetical protein
VRSKLTIEIDADPDSGELAVVARDGQVPVWRATLTGFELPDEAVADALRSATLDWLRRYWREPTTKRFG